MATIDDKVFVIAREREGTEFRFVNLSEGVKSARELVGMPLTSTEYRETTLRLGLGAGPIDPIKANSVRLYLEGRGYKVKVIKYAVLGTINVDSKEIR